MEERRRRHLGDETSLSSDDTDVRGFGIEDDEAYFSDDPVDTGVGTGDVLDVLNRHLQCCDFSVFRCGRIIICDKSSSFSTADFEVSQGSDGCPYALVPTPHQAGHLYPDTDGCPDAPGRTLHQESEVGVFLKNWEKDLGVQPAQRNIFLIIAGATIPPSLFEKLSSLLEPGVIIDVQIAEANVEKVREMMEKVGLANEIHRDFSIPAGSRVAQEVKTGDIYTQDDLAGDDNRGTHKTLLDWAAGGTMSLCVLRSRKPREKRSADTIGGNGPKAKRICQ